MKYSGSRRARRGSVAEVSICRSSVPGMIPLIAIRLGWVKLRPLGSALSEKNTRDRPLYTNGSGELTYGVSAGMVIVFTTVHAMPPSSVGRFRDRKRVG